MHTIQGDMPAQYLYTEFSALLTDDFADPLGNLVTEDFTPILRDPHNVQMVRKDRMGAMAIVTHVP